MGCRQRTKFVLFIKADIARLLFGDDVDARTSGARSLRSKRCDQSGANAAIAVAFIEINVQMARIAITQRRKITDVGKARIVRRIFQTAREIAATVLTSVM